ncbi:aminotransferase class I/II-fold pyridoxal phosphate-dependent enzyme [Ottowia sp. GY511]|uniref:histidinol-phosphate transaminase n=1 Tax=Ottowia flava TaxID=2675430 RepID=A0ABW4KT27_9BURK|nr:aminotransferase class I/II-fold pyridoxal phosphate-dependent enzyme [Ottowia sp. GY511]TXK26610.1 aminotransferase class I/II-fold pyridoxal phosphate-dependent enzyme [Ottowia sp. GY511]
MRFLPLHGGADALGVPAHDFSTNANACGPCPCALAALSAADRSRYPDPTYTALRARIAEFHGVAADRVVFAASASEAIHRLSAMAARAGLRHAVLPAHGYGDYPRAAAVWGLQASAPNGFPALHWACEPASPLGTADAALAHWAAAPDVTESLRVIDMAYAPLRLDGNTTPTPPGAWQLWTPNKALGLTGVRAAYLLAPSANAAAALDALAPSWPLGADGVALLTAWASDEAQAWLRASLPTLRAWKATQMQLCAELGWAVHSGSLANFFVARPPLRDLPGALQALRAQGIKLRDTASFGLPGQVRLGVLPPASQNALREAWVGLGARYH